MKAVITKSKQTDLSHREPIAIEQAPARRVGPRLEGPRKKLPESEVAAGNWLGLGAMLT